MRPVDAVAAALPIAAVTSLLWWSATQLFPRMRLLWMARKLPGPTAWPLAGNAFDLLFKDRETVFKVILGMFRRHGSVFRLWMGPKLVVAVGCPRAAHRILYHPKIINRDHHFNLAVDGVAAGSLFTARVDDFRRHRKTLERVFHPAMLASYAPAIGLHADRLAAALRESRGKTVNIKDHLATCAIRLIFDTIIGSKDMQIDEVKCTETGRVIDLAIYLCYKRMSYPWLLVDWLAPFTKQGRLTREIHKQAMSISEDTLTAKQSTLAASDVAPHGVSTAGAKTVHNFLDMVFAAAARGETLFDDAVVRGDLFTFLVASVDTSSCSMAYVLMMLGMHPAYQERVFAEQTSIFGDSLRAATSVDVAKMPELELVIKETLRLYAPASLLPREIPEDIELDDGVVIPGGCSVFIFNHAIHRDPDNFVEPDRFWPERWLPEHNAGRHAGAYLPFSAGQRRCIGQRYAQLTMRTLLSRLLREFRVECGYTMDDLERVKVGVSNASVVGYDVRMRGRGGSRAERAAA